VFGRSRDHVNVIFAIYSNTQLSYCYAVSIVVSSNIEICCCLLENHWKESTSRHVTMGELLDHCRVMLLHQRIHTVSRN